MVAKRFSTISLFIAFVVIASSIVSLLPQALSPQIAEATVQQSFTTVGTTNWSVPTGVTWVQVLVVAGGGGGGGAAGLLFVFRGAGGGGGAGGLIYNASYPVTPGQNISVTVGAGGNGGSGNDHGNNGGNSVFGTLTATGGGGGSGTSSHAHSGGSGGGGGAWTGGDSNGASGTAGQGKNGGNGANWGGGGGGGNTSAGANGNNDGGDGGAGGNYSSIFGTGVGENGWFAGGGGGAGAGDNGDGGNGGGGDGRNGGAFGGGNGGAGTANTGGGGGGAYAPAVAGGYTGGKGGSGIVIIRYNYAPAIGTVALWTTGGSPAETTAMTPQVEFNIKIPVTDNDNLTDLVTVNATLYYDSDGTYNASEVPTSGNTQTCAILTWTKSTNTLTISSGVGSSWAVNNSSSVFPSLSGTSGTFEFHFKPGKVATYTTGAAKWHIYVKATDSVSNTGTSTKQNLTMNWYGEINVSPTTIDWGYVDAGLAFAEGGDSEESGIIVTYISNGAYKEKIAALGTWTSAGAGPDATLDSTEAVANTNEFSLRADDTDTMGSHVSVDTTSNYKTIDDGGTITGESGNAETNSIWLKLSATFIADIYTGTIYYQITQ